SNGPSVDPETPSRPKSKGSYVEQLVNSSASARMKRAPARGTAEEGTRSSLPSDRRLASPSLTSHSLHLCVPQLHGRTFPIVSDQPQPYRDSSDQNSDAKA